MHAIKGKSELSFKVVKSKLVARLLNNSEDIRCGVELRYALHLSLLDAHNITSRNIVTGGVDIAYAKLRVANLVNEFEALGNK